MNPCPLCHAKNETLLWQDGCCRAILVDDADYPGFCRVIWKAHAKEMTDLSDDERMHFMSVVFTVERTIRELLKPDKINLASLGNQVPHLHWHVIPRFTDDAHFPDPVWAMRKRDGKPHSLDVPLLGQRLCRVLGPALPYNRRTE